MTTKQDNTDDDSFIIVLGTSPGASMDVEKSSIENEMLNKSQIEDAMKDMSVEANMAFKAQFQLVDSPSAASMMVASTLITDDRSTEELQKRFGELLDENVVLKETLKQNNESMKEQFLLIASCQEDMLRTHKLHKEKFDETKDLVERLRQENRKLKLDVVRIAESEPQVNGLTDGKSGASSGVEFVTSPDDDTIDKLTAQLELVEKQRRQVIVENEKLTWQKESLEHIVDVTTKERDDLKEKLNNLELQLSSKENAYAQEMNKLHSTVKDLQNKLMSSSASVSLDEVQKRDAAIKILEGKVTTLQNDLKNAQIKILDLENIKLEFTQHKSGVSDTVKMYKEQIQELNNRLKEAQKTVFQPVRFSISSEPSTPTSEYAQYASNIKLYDRTLKHLSEFLNELTNGLSDSLVQTLGVAASLHDFKLERANAERVRSGLADVKALLEKQHSVALSNIGQVRGILSIFEGIFKDFNELLKRVVSKQESKPSSAVNVEALTSALVARGQEIQGLQSEIAALKGHKEDIDLLKAQIDLYKSDFEAERESRQKMASEKENIATDLRTAQRRIQELVTQLEEVRKLSPGIHRTVTAKRASSPPSPPSPSGFMSPSQLANKPRGSTATTGNMVYTCPKCQRFSSDQIKVMDDHFDFCLDDF
ncbi:optineurin isoform X2 [Epargyreus clarus]|uniref:optineurin isoform X2 n=1 Tax=Epargyreus clarus TaxID=520877 RepID=UPI003C2C10B2